MFFNLSVVLPYKRKRHLSDKSNRVNQKRIDVAISYLSDWTLLNIFICVINNKVDTVWMLCVHSMREGDVLFRGPLWQNWSKQKTITDYWVWPNSTNIGIQKISRYTIRWGSKNRPNNPYIYKENISFY